MEAQANRITMNRSNVTGIAIIAFVVGMACGGWFAWSVWQEAVDEMVADGEMTITTKPDK